MFVLKNFNGKTLRGKVTEKRDNQYIIRWDDGAFGILDAEDENKWYRLFPECHVVDLKNNVIFRGMFEECRDFCKNAWTIAKHTPDFLVRNGCTEVIFLNSIVAQIIAE